MMRLKEDMNNLHLCERWSTGGIKCLRDPEAVEIDGRRTPGKIISYKI